VAIERASVWWKQANMFSSCSTQLRAPSRFTCDGWWGRTMSGGIDAGLEIRANFRGRT